MLRLVAQGLTDAQIAEYLIVSPRTVNTHPTSIPCRYYTLVTRWITSAQLQHSLGPYHALVRGSPAVENRQHLSRASPWLALALVTIAPLSRRWWNLTYLAPHEKVLVVRRPEI